MHAAASTQCQQSWTSAWEQVTETRTCIMKALYKGKSGVYGTLWLITDPFGTAVAGCDALHLSGKAM